MKRDKTTAAAVKTKAHLLIIEARFYADICDELAKGAIAAIEKAGATWERVDVPGALEIPGGIALAAKSKRFDGFVALGCVLRGETTHYEIVSGESARGIMDLTMTGLIIGNGILTCENEIQAWARARVTEMDKGGGAADTALAMIRFARSIKKRQRKS
ncbi:6,7-dimethyl-8-ribityllumazine synthase [Taklimakanibacter albus]|uniref:6,7-dimethyl-8-ribityllumazine synthase n=1 Tax=Taklimakanibacter albus TaxID=2800327 RepID=A0ACC5R0U7_9HYPH|nr:6,7-dimethyl-8-ribityllumazine synthase [Aestuariivirga sp. YIM B02566]